MKTNENNPFTSKDSLFSKDWSSYNTLDMGKTFFSDGLVANSNTFYVFDNKTIFNNAVIKDEPLFYKKSELPITIYTVDNEQEVLDTFKKLEINYDEIAVFFFKKNSKTALKINLGNSLLKLSNFKNEKEMESKIWNLPKTEFDKLNNELSAKAVFQFLNKNNFLFPETVEEITGYLPKQKTKVHFTIGVFFDGTGNNRFNSEENYYKKINKDKVVYSHIPKEKKLSNGTIIQNDDSHWNPYSNIVLLHDLYDFSNLDKSNPNKFTRTLKIYVQGIGTLKDFEDDIKGSGFGEGERGIIGKVNEGCAKLANEIKTTLGKDYEIGSLTFDVFGFSRGAAAARHFCNEIVGKGTIKTAIEKGKVYKDSKGNILTQDKDKIIGKDYFLGLLGENLKLLDVQSKVRQLNSELNKVNIRFVGLFDTVVGQFVVQENFGKKLDIVLGAIPSTRILVGIGTHIETKLDIVKQKIDNLPIQKIVHFVANDEWRENFATTNVLNNKNNLEFINNKNIFEIKLPGAHSDIGGGYAATKKDIDFLAQDISTYEGYKQKEEIPERLKILKDFYIKKGYCTTKNNEIQIMPTIVTKLPSTAGYSFTEYYQLIATRKITPRYSIVNMYAMRELAKFFNVPFIVNIDKTKYPFEYKTPKDLINYQTELIEKLKLEIQNKKAKPQKYSVNKNKFIHLSSNYNAAKYFDKKGESIIGVKNFDKIFYINHPNYLNNEETSYVRKIHIHNQ